jgi:2-keto-4-pentenoate hydratase
VSLKPSTRQQGYAIQSELERLSGASCVGWKIAATSAARQDHIGVDGPLAGRIFAARVLDTGAMTSIANNRRRVVEPEFAFRLGRALVPRRTPYSTAEILAAVEGLHLALELPDSRFIDFAAVGGPISNVHGRYRRDGVGANVLGDPRTALTWLVNELSSLGVTLHAGDVVTTGTCMTPLPVVEGDQITADFGALGKIAVTIAVA